MFQHTLTKEIPGILQKLTKSTSPKVTTCSDWYR